MNDDFSAIEEWKNAYWNFVNPHAFMHREIHRSLMYRCRYAAALERLLAARDRRIAELEERIEDIAHSL